MTKKEMAEFSVDPFKKRDNILKMLSKNIDTIHKKHQKKLTKIQNMSKTVQKEIQELSKVRQITSMPLRHQPKQTKAHYSAHRNKLTGRFSGKSSRLQAHKNKGKKVHGKRIGSKSLSKKRKPKAKRPKKNRKKPRRPRRLHQTLGEKKPHGKFDEMELLSKLITKSRSGDLDLQ